MIRQKLIEYCDKRPIVEFVLRAFATTLSTISLIAAIIAVAEHKPVTTYVDSEEASFGSYWRVPILLAVVWNTAQLIYLCIRGHQFPRSFARGTSSNSHSSNDQDSCFSLRTIRRSIRPFCFAIIEFFIFALLLGVFSAFLATNRIARNHQTFGFSAVEAWLGLFSGFFNLLLAIAACQGAKRRRVSRKKATRCSGDVE